MNNIPKGWELKVVDDLFEVKLGKMLNKVAKEITPQFKYIGNSNVRWGCFDLDDLKTMYFNEKEKEKFQLKINDVLMCEGGEVGRCAIWQSEDTEIFYQKAIHRLRTKGDILPVYFQNYMQHISGTKRLDDFTTRTSIAHLTREKLVKLPVKLPTLPEQTKIAEILSTWDNAINTTEQLLANSQQQKKSLMQQLLTGKKRLKDENREVFCGDWEKVTLNQIADMNSGGTPKSKNEKYYNGTIPWVSIADMTKQGKWLFKTGKNITKLGLESSSARMYPEKTVLYAMYASIGECSIALEPMTSSQAILGIIPKENLYYEYLYYYLSSYKEKIKLQGQQGTQSNLNAGMVKAFKLKLPPLPEQQAIAKVLTTADQQIDSLQQQIAKLKDEKKGLMQVLLSGKKRVSV